MADYEAAQREFGAFVETIAALRAPDGCPWDREQTHQSIAHNMIEEAYEAVDAIEADDTVHLREELGDVLLQVVLQSQIAADEGEFTVADVCRDVNDKMIRRHPHVFGEASAANANEVLDLWDKVKLAEAAGAGVGAGAVEVAGAEAAGVGADGSVAADVRRTGLLDGVPKSLPALMQAQKISRKAVSAGFEWDTLDDVWVQVQDEMHELEFAYEAAPKTDDGKIEAGSAEAAAVEMELGDVLFSLVNVARRMGVDAESALRASCVKFRQRWAHMEHSAWAQGCNVEDYSRDELEDLWREAKAAE